MTPEPCRRPGLRAEVGEVAGGWVDLARVLRVVDPAVPLRTSAAAAGFMAGRGFPVPSDTEVLYAAVENGTGRRPACVVGVFRSARRARAYAEAAGWADFDVVPYRPRPSWTGPGQL